MLYNGSFSVVNFTISEIELVLLRDVEAIYNFKLYYDCLL